MNDTSTPATTERYLSTLADELSAVPAGRRAAIVDDIRTHIADALDEGRPLPQILERLGSPKDVAADALGDTERPQAIVARPSDAAARILLFTATAVGVLTAVFVSFFMIAGTATPAIEGAETATFSLVDMFGLGVSLLALVPVVFAVLPLLLPQRMRAGFTLAGAVIVLLLMGALFEIGAFYVPFTMLMVAAVIAPRIIERGIGRAASRVWRIIAAALLLLPALLTVAGLIAGSILLAWGPIVWLATMLTLAVLVIIDSRAGYLATSAFGAAVMVLAVISGGMLLIAFWWAGGLYLTVGLMGWLVSSRRQLA